MRAHSCFHCFCDVRGGQRQLFCQDMARLCHTQLWSDPTTFKSAPEISMSVWKRRVNPSLYYLSFCDRKNTQQKFISYFDIVVINDNLLRHTGVSRIPHFLSLLLITKKTPKVHCFLHYGKKYPGIKSVSGLCHVQWANKKCSDVLEGSTASSRATALPVALGEIVYIIPPSGTGHFSCILAELCWL